MVSSTNETQTILRVDESLLAAARNAAAVCLGATAGDRAVVIYDAATRSIAAGLQEAFLSLGAEVRLFDLDGFGERPLGQLPGAIAQALAAGTISCLALTTPQGELGLRRAVYELAGRHRLRHAHMPAITPEIFATGLAMDYREVARFVNRLGARLAEGRQLRLTTAAGSDLTVRLGEPVALELADGLIRADRWQNLPSGQVIVLPEDVSGRYVVDGAIGDWFWTKYDVRQTPVTVELERGHIRAISTVDRRLERELSLYLRSGDNSARVSEFVIGANLYLGDEHRGPLFEGYRPGASLAVGALGQGTGAGFAAPTFVPLMCRGANLTLDGAPLMQADRFIRDLITASVAPTPLS